MGCQYRDAVLSFLDLFYRMYRCNVFYRCLIHRQRCCVLVLRRSPFHLLFSLLIESTFCRLLCAKMELKFHDSKSNLFMFLAMEEKKALYECTRVYSNSVSCLWFPTVRCNEQVKLDFRTIKQGQIGKKAGR